MLWCDFENQIEQIQISITFLTSAPGETVPDRHADKPSTESKSEPLVSFRSDAGASQYGSVISPQGAIMGNANKAGGSGVQGAAATYSSPGYSQVRAPQPYRADESAAGKAVGVGVDPTKSYSGQTQASWTSAQYSQVEVTSNK